MMNSNQVYMNPMSVPHQQLTAMPSTSVRNGEGADSKIGKSSNFVASIAQQPPPPPPSSPGPSDTPAFYTDITSKRMQIFRYLLMSVFY